MVQQLSGKKRKFSNMLRTDPSDEWSIPPFPKVIMASTKPTTVFRHLLGEHGLASGALTMDLLTTLAAEILHRNQTTATASVSHPTIHSAVAAGSLGLVRMLLQIDLAQVHARDLATDDTPLHVAARCGHDETVVALFQSGARLVQTNMAGETPEMAARCAGNTVLADRLRSWHMSEFSSGSTDIFRAAGTGALSSLRQL